MKSWEEILSKILHVVRLDTIRRRIIAFAILATLIPSFTMGWLSYTQSHKLLAEKTAEELRNATAHASQELSLWLKERRHEARVFSNSYEVTENLEKSFSAQERAGAVRRLKSYLNIVRRKFADYEELLAVDGRLAVIASSRKKASKLQLPADWQKHAREDTPIIGPPYLDTGKNIRVMMLGTPVRSSVDGRLLGLLVVKLNFRTIEGLLKESPVARSGKVYVVAQDGALITGSVAFPASLMEGKLEESVLQSLYDERGTPVEYPDYEGVNVMGTLKPVTSLGWHVVAEIAKSRAFAEMIRNRNLTLLIVSGLLIIVGSLAYFLGLSIVRPLERLAGGAERVAEGDLDVDLPSVGQTEVGYLTGNFNEMVGRLREGRQELADSNQALSEKNKELEKLSITDGLTGLYNRKHLMETLVNETSRSRRHRYSFCVMMLDIDHFKRYNDTFGHLSGDQLLAKVASLLRESVRDIDYVARYGGEEFLIMLPQCTTKQAFQVGQRLRARVAAETANDPNLPESVTLSAGLAAYPDNGDTPVAVILSADAALYEAKRSGRNKIMIASGKPKVSTPVA